MRSGAPKSGGRGALQFRRWLPGLLLATGIFLIAASVYSGSARLFLLVFVPVITGTSWEFLLGVSALFAGFFLLPLIWTADEAEDPSLRAAARTGPGPPAASTELRPLGRDSAGGLILVGPVPIFIGGWRDHPPIPYRWALVAGVVLVALAVLLFVFGVAR